ncbi:cAMP-dependent protein kinase type II regulatory subunit-like isoform X3 [Tachypleus tridentatus]|uniref:cAMP-dependent protein kinase type II regulatory subunit-like isoform X3 n=1 Tax=Tachypleus tridentatus TaxID=6853 RepID=UPI003FD08ABF
MSQTNRISVPPELTDILLEFTVNVLVEKPVDIVNYAVNYFTKLRTERQQNGTKNVEFENDAGASEDEDILDEESPRPPNRFARRKSVFAEHYDPEEDEDDDNDKVVYPKSDEQRQQLAEAVRNILLFRSLEQEQVQEVLDAMFEKKVQMGEVVIRQGDDGDNFYVIQSGIYNIYVNTDQEHEKFVGKYDNTGSFGELALMYNQPRAATIKAATDGSLWAMPYERMNLCDALMPKSYKDDMAIIKQGEVGDGMYFVESGTVRIVMVSESGEEKEVSKLNKGQYFGELALVTHKPRAASVYSVGDVKLAFLDVQAFERLLGPCMDIMKRNINEYEEQFLKVFGSKTNISDLR